MWHFLYCERLKIVTVIGQWSDPKYSLKIGKKTGHNSLKRINRRRRPDADVKYFLERFIGEQPTRTIFPHLLGGIHNTISKTLFQDLFSTGNKHYDSLTFLSGEWQDDWWCEWTSIFWQKKVSHSTVRPSIFIKKSEQQL